MELYLFILTLLFVLRVDGGATETCPASTGTSFNLFIASRRNLTGHWIVTVDGEREHPLPLPPSTTSSPLEVAIEVGHHATSCGDSETVRLTATAVIKPVSTDYEVTDTAVTLVEPVTQATPHVPSSVIVPTSQEAVPTPLLPVTTSAQGLPPQAPPAGYEVVSGTGYYRMHTAAATWAQARERCFQEGAYLLIINSDQEADVAKTLLIRDVSKIQGAYSTYYAYVGFDDIANEGNYTTVLGESLLRSGYTRWDREARHSDREANCGLVRRDGFLFVSPCDIPYGFICEISVQY